MMREKTSEKEEYEFCPRCEANLTLQKGYDNALPYWICKGCGEMLINPEMDDDSNVVWLCDECGACLNIQEGFENNCGEWKCSECGFVNKIDMREIYSSEDEYIADLYNPYKGMADNDIIELMNYEDITGINDRDDVILVRNLDDNQLYIKKILTVYDSSVYRYLMDNPIQYIPTIRKMYKGDRHLVIIEDYISGDTLSHILSRGPLKMDTAIDITIKLCDILVKLHGAIRPIIHRDIKPSNIILAPDNSVYLIDINVAKWYSPTENEDTKLLGTMYYAAPEQLGYGFSSSSTKVDIYAMGILLNVMITGKLPKEERAAGSIWPIIEKCISLKPEDRYTDTELFAELLEYKKRGQ